MQYSSLIRFIYAKTLVMDLNVLKNETEICGFGKAHLTIFTLSDKWNHLVIHLSLDCNAKASLWARGTAESHWPQVQSRPAPPVPCGKLSVKSGLLVWLVSSPASQRGRRYLFSRTKAMHTFLISAGKRGCCLPALPQQGRLLPPCVVQRGRLAPGCQGHVWVWTWMPELTGACFRVLIPHYLDQGLVPHSACACFIGLSLYFVGVGVTGTRLALALAGHWDAAGVGLQTCELSSYRLN